MYHDLADATLVAEIRGLFWGNPSGEGFPQTLSNSGPGRVWSFQGRTRKLRELLQLSTRVQIRAFSFAICCCVQT